MDYNLIGWTFSWSHLSKIIGKVWFKFRPTKKSRLAWINQMKI